ncbi:MAG: hypothetical protein O7A71_05115, partial [Chloroflexi bacterium]|nr:hypothetical protein [Chloroflexota bacterium]
VDSEQVCRNVEVQLQSFAGDWHSIWQCGEAREGEDFAYNWQVSLAQTDDQVGGRISFHACPGRGRIQYEVTGVVDPKSDTVTLEGVRRISLGPLGGNSPFRTTFTLLRLGEPDPNLDPVHDLAIAVTPLGTAVFVDEPIEYRVTVTNRGGDKAEDVEVTISPGGASWEFLSSPSDCETIGLLHVICQVGSLGPGQSASFFFALVPTSSGEMQTVIRVDAAGSDFIQGSNDRTVKVAVIEAP